MKRMYLLLLLVAVLTLTACAAPSAPQDAAPAAPAVETQAPAPEPTALPPTETPAPEPTATPAPEAETADAEDSRPLFEPALTDQIWQWVTFTSPVEQVEIANPEMYQVTFQPDGSVSILADCNRANASFTDEDGAIQIVVGPATMALCTPDSRSDQFIAYLGFSARYFFQDGNFFIDLFADGGTMTFAPVAVATLATQADGSLTGEMGGASAVLGNLTYNGVLPEEEITLTDGIGNYTEAGGGTPFVRLVDHSILTDDLDGDGTEDAVAVLVDFTTGSADFVYLVAVLDVLGQPTPSTAVLLGDRTPVKAMTIDGGEITLDFIGPGESDAACCPTWNVRKTFAVADGQLVEQSSEEINQASLADLDGTSWQLVSLGEAQPSLLPDGEITLQFADGQISGSASCNSYTGSISGDDTLPQVMTVGPLAVTAMMCAEPIANQETAYLDALSKVSAWRYDFGFLALNYRLDDGSIYELSFAPAQ